MRSVLLGVLGHVDHGKTALVRALTGIETDRLPEEKARGISIALGFARLQHDDAEIDLVDVPGHERFLRTMVAGATAIQAALLCIDAREGVRAQTVEHAEVAALLGLSRGAVAITRCDLTSGDDAAAGASALLARLGLGDWPVVLTSAVTGAGIPELKAQLARLARPPEATAMGAWLPVDRAFSRPGAGTVVTGALRRAPLAVEDEVEIWPGGQRSRLRGVQLHGQPVALAQPGRRTALALRGVTPAEVPPGSALATPGLLAESRRLDVQVALLASAPAAVLRGDVLRLLVGTAETGARLHLLEDALLAPGATTVAQLRLEAPLAVPARERFVLRTASPPRTIGGGVVLDPTAPRRSFRDAPLLRAMHAATPVAAAALRLQAAGPQGATGAALARVAGLLPAALDLPEAVRLTGDLLLHREVHAKLEAAAVAAVEQAQRQDPTAPGPSLSTLRAALPRAAPVEALLARLVAADKLHLAAGRFTRRGLDPLALLPPAARALLEAVEEAFRSGGLAPPDAVTVIGGQRQRAQAVALLLRRGQLIRAPDAVQKREVLFHRSALATARQALRQSFADTTEGFLVGECGRLLGISRRFAVPLLERLDAEGLTRRDGDRRHIVTEPMHPPGA